MARYEHLPIFRDAYDLTVHLEKIVRNFSRYHKYTLGTDLRNQSRRVLDLIVRANEATEGRAARLLELRQELESLKVLARLCQDLSLIHISRARRKSHHPANWPLAVCSRRPTCQPRPADLRDVVRRGVRATGQPGN